MLKTYDHQLKSRSAILPISATTAMLLLCTKALDGEGINPSAGLGAGAEAPVPWVQGERQAYQVLVMS